MLFQMLPSVIKRVFFFCGSKTVAATMFLLKYLALFIAIFKNSANQNGIFAICSLRMLLVH